MTNQIVIASNYKAIAEGIFEMMPSKVLSPLYYGMIPIEIHDMLERLMREKLAKILLTQTFGIPESDMTASMIDSVLPAVLDSAVDERVKGIEVELLSLAIADSEVLTGSK